MRRPRFKSLLYLGWLGLLLMGAEGRGTQDPKTPAPEKPSALDTLGEKYPEIPWEAVGLLQASVDKKNRIYQTGFFISPTLFITAISPRKEPPSNLDCIDETYVFSGAARIVPDFNNEKVKPTHRCVRVRAESSELGFVLLEVEALTKEVFAHKLDIVARQSPVGENEALLVLGYAFSRGGELTLVENVRVQKPVYAFDETFVNENFSGRHINLLWGLAKAKLPPGMVGSPVFRKHRGAWRPAGMIAMLQAPTTAADAPTVFSKLFQFRDQLFPNEEER